MHNWCFVKQDFKETAYNSFLFECITDVKDFKGNCIQFTSVLVNPYNQFNQHWFVVLHQIFLCSKDVPFCLDIKTGNAFSTSLVIIWCFSFCLWKLHFVMLKNWKMILVNHILDLNWMWGINANANESLECQRFTFLA